MFITFVYLVVGNIMTFLKCKRCQNVWNYEGSNSYCTNCSRCKSTVFVRNPSVISFNDNGLRNDLLKEERKVIDNIPTASKK